MSRGRPREPGQSGGVARRSVVAFSIGFAMTFVAAACGSKPAPTGPAPSEAGSPVPNATAARPGASATGSGGLRAPAGSSAPAASSAPTESAPNSAATVLFTARRLGVSLAVATTRAVAFADGADLLLAGGLTASGTTAAVVRIVIAGDTSTAIGRLAHPVHDAGGASLGGRNLVFGGGSAIAEAWVQTAGPPTSATGPGALPAPRADLAAVPVGTQVIIVGGGAAGRADPRVLATTDGVHYRVVARLPIAVRYAAVAAFDGRVFVVGGTSAAGDVAAIQIVDPGAGTARIVGRLGSARSHAAALAIGGEIVIAGGRHGGLALDTMITVDPSTFRVSSAGRLPLALSDAAAVMVGGVGYLLGGEDRGPLTTILSISPT